MKDWKGREEKQKAMKKLWKRTSFILVCVMLFVVQIESNSYEKSKTEDGKKTRDGRIR